MLNILARESQLRVISRTSSFAFKDQAIEVPEIAKRLKVGHILEGSVRKAGETVRITAQLVEARSDTHLWSETWDRELTNILAIQDEIAAAVAESLQTVLLGAVGSAVTEELTEAELEAYELVLKGRYLLNQFDQDASQRAVNLYERAIEVAPDYAPAHSGLAKVLRQMMSFGAIDPDVAVPRIETALDRALELDPNVAPTNVLVSMWLAYALSRFDRFDEAMAVLRDWHALYPESSLPFSMAGVFYFQTRQFDLTLKSYYKVFRMAPDRVDDEIDGLVWLFIDGLSMPYSELVLQWGERRIANNPESAVGHMQKIIFTSRSGQRAEAARLIDELAEQHPEWALIHARLNLIFHEDYFRSREWWEAAGVRKGLSWELNFFAGFMHAIRSENLLALEYLRQDAANRGLSAVSA